MPHSVRYDRRAHSTDRTRARGALASEQLTLGLDVIVECVNPIAATRDAWVSTATAADAGSVEVEVVCSDLAEHRRRIETRASDVDGLVKPTWDEVVGREYEPWNRPHLVIDLSNVALLDSTILHAVLDALDCYEINGHLTIIIDSRSAAFTRTEISMLSEIVDVHHDLASALRVCARASISTGGRHRAKDPGSAI